MTFKMAWGRRVGLCIKFVWNLHFDWLTVWANSTVTYRSDRDVWQLWTVAEVAFKTQPVRAGETFPGSLLIHLPPATAPPAAFIPPATPPPAALLKTTLRGVVFNKADGDVFPDWQDGNLPGVVPLLLLLPEANHWLHPWSPCLWNPASSELAWD